MCAVPIRTVKDAVEFFDPVSSSPHKRTLRSAKMAYGSYRQRLDRDKEERQKLKRKD